MTGKFDASDPARRNLLELISTEANSSDGSLYPALILLDEANLSPMEYYWSDWMRFCDEEAGSDIRLTDGLHAKVPPTLRFLATINSDATTETLSPRILDRTMVVTLPDMALVGLSTCNTIACCTMPPWSSLEKIFGRQPITEPKVFESLKEIYSQFDCLGIRISPRSRRQIEGYVGTASSIFTDLPNKPAFFEALDFAVLQKYSHVLTARGNTSSNNSRRLVILLEKKMLTRSQQRTEAIIKKGTKDMNCFRFF